MFTSLHHLIDIGWMSEAYRRTRKDGATGIDGVTAADYEKDLEANLESLLNRIKSGSYRAPPVRRHYIPKADGTKRPLGIPTFEDKVAQRAILMLLEPIYETGFLPCSYGFRRGRSAHDALSALRKGIIEQRQRWVIDADISKYFDSITHSHLRSFLDLRIKDGVARRMIDKWLKAGVLEEDALHRPVAGTPQGGVISPMLSNVYPRAEVRYLPESAIADAPKIVAGVPAGKAYAAVPVPSQPVIRKGRNGSFHDKGLEGASHHAVIPNVNTIDDLGEIWPRLSVDEKKLFDAIARSYLASVMPDYRYRQTTVTLDVRGFAFRAAGRQPIEAGWREAFPDWRPAEEKGEEARALPVLRDGETARLHDPEIEDKETRPPPRYKEGTLIEAMQNAWRFVEDEALRERLKEAKGIGTPATRGEIIAGLKKQGFLTVREKNIVPSDRGLALFGVLERADPALVDPGVTAELECLLDDVVLGKQEMTVAIDAICDAARGIIGSLGEGAGGGAAVALGDASGGYSGKDRPPTAAMKRFAVSIARRKGIDPPKGYTKSAAVCRAFLELHAPERTTGSAGRNGAAGTRPPSAAQVSYAEAIARERDITVPDEARACSTAMSKWIDANRPAKPATGRRASAHKSRDQTAKGKAARARAQRRRKPGDAAEGAAPSAGARAEAPAGTPLRIPYGNKEAAFALGTRYASGGWYAPPGVDLSAFRERGWL